MTRGAGSLECGSGATTGRQSNQATEPQRRETPPTPVCESGAMGLLDGIGSYSREAALLVERLDFEHVDPAIFQPLKYAFADDPRIAVGLLAQGV